MARRLALVLALAVALVLAGCSAPAHPEGPPTVAEEPAPTTTGPETTDAGGTPGGTDADGTTAADSRIAIEGDDPETDPQVVLDRVSRLRALEANDTITVETFAGEDEGPVDYPDRVAYLGLSGTQALQLSSSARVETFRSPGLTLLGATGVRVRLLEAEAVRADWNVSQEAVLAHELVHALQFQRVGTFSVREYRTTDAYLAALAMFEGDAVLVSEQYADRHLDGETIGRSFYNRSFDRGSAPFSVSNGAYAAGYRYFATLNASPADRTAAIRSPPNTTAAVLHPRTDIERPPLPAAAENETYEVVGEDRPGELVIRRAFRVNGVGYRDSAAAAAGWRNGSLYRYSAPSSTPVHWVTRWASAAEAREFADAWRALLDSRNATRRGGLLVVPATETTDQQLYHVAVRGDTVHVTAGETTPGVRELAALWNVSGDRERAVAADRPAATDSAYRRTGRS